MNVLFLGYCDKELIDFINRNDTVYWTDQKIDNWDLFPVEFIISYGYRFKVPEGVTQVIPCINLHISYLPWNRGADPNFWSFKDNTPKGVTIHKMDKGIDTGDILLQELVELSDDDTFRDTYSLLHYKIRSLFVDNWDDLRENKIKGWRQSGGSYHRSRDKNEFIESLGLHSAWLDIPIKEII